MSGQNGHRTIITTEDWMRDMEKRTLHDYRRPQIRTASDLLGPGVGPQAVQIVDWNDEVTTFNGFFYSMPGAQNSPDGNKYWMGYVVANDVGGGYMRVYEYAPNPTVATTPVLTYVRNFQTTPGSLRSFGQWVNSGGGGGAQFVGESGRTYRLYSGTIRNDGSGWSFINDSAHHPSGFTGAVIINSDNIELPYTVPGAFVSSLQVTADETLASIGVRVGASVGLTSVKIYLYRQPSDRISDYIEYSGSAWTSANGTFTFGTFTGGLLTVNHESMGSASQWGVSLGNRGNAVAQLGSVGDATLQMAFYTGSFGSLTAVTTPTTALCRVWLTRFGRRASVPAEAPGSVVSAFGNIWITGFMEV